MRALSAILSGCVLVGAGGCSEENEQGSGRSVTVRPEESVEIAADEYRFDPSRITVKSAGRNVRFRVVLDNRGTLAHNIHVRDGDRELAGLRSFPAGEKRPLAVNLVPGEYDFVCTVADHEDLGMVGRLEIR